MTIWSKVLNARAQLVSVKIKHLVWSCKQVHPIQSWWFVKFCFLSNIHSAIVGYSSSKENKNIIGMKPPQFSIVLRFERGYRFDWWNRGIINNNKNQIPIFFLFVWCGATSNSRINEFISSRIGVIQYDYDNSGPMWSWLMLKTSLFVKG